MARLRKSVLDGNIQTFLLAVLEDGPSYGYEIVRDLNSRADGLFRFGEGTVYPILHRMEEKGLVSGWWRKGPTGRPRKYYKLTPKGRRRISKDREEWQQLVRLVEAVVDRGPSSAEGAF